MICIIYVELLFRPWGKPEAISDAFTVVHIHLTWSGEGASHKAISSPNLVTCLCSNDGAVTVAYPLSGTGVLEPTLPPTLSHRKLERPREDQ